MEDVETRVQKLIVIFCKSLPGFVEKWRGLLQDAVRPVRGLVNQAEQLRHVENVKSIEMDDFEGCRERILFKIYQGIEDEIVIIKDILENLTKINSDLKNKLTLLENSTLDLNWDDDESSVIRGSATQPSLTNLLQYSLDFWTYFSAACKNINALLKGLDVRDEKYMCEFENAFKVDFGSKCVTNLIAITQYVDNEGAIV